MKWIKHWFGNVKLCNIVPRFIPTNEVPRTDWNYMANDILHCSFLVPFVINLFMFIGNWDILTLLVMRDIIYFILVTFCGMNVMYRVMFVLVADLVVCIYVIYL